MRRGEDSYSYSDRPLTFSYDGANDVCFAALKFPDTFRPIQFGDGFACSEADEEYGPPARPNSTSDCIQDLLFITGAGGGTLGRRDPSTADGSAYEPFIFGVGPVPASCPSADLGLRAYRYPCVSHPFKALSYRSECGLTVRAGCANSDAADGTWAQVGCEQRAGSRIDFRGLAEARSANGTIDTRLSGEWLVGERSAGEEPDSFWVYRADGEPHGIGPEDTLLAASGGAASVRCLLQTVPKPGEACCYDTFAYALGCAAPPPPPAGAPPANATTSATTSTSAPPVGAAARTPPEVVLPNLGLRWGYLLGGALVPVALALSVGLLRRRCGRTRRKQPPLLASRDASRPSLEGLDRSSAGAGMVEGMAAGRGASEPAPLHPDVLEVAVDLSNEPADVAHAALAMSLPRLPAWDVMYVEDRAAVLPAAHDRL